METTNPGQDDSAAVSRLVAVVTDSASAIPPEMAAEFGIGIAPMEITIDGRTHIEGPSGSLRTFYTDLIQADRLPTTSAPKPQVWLDAINEAAKVADSVLCITLASNLSAAYDAARVAKDLARDELPNTNIRVFDSESAAGSQALIALAAARAAARGDSLDEVEAAAEHVTSRVRLVAFLETLKFIHKGGARAPHRLLGDPIAGHQACTPVRKRTGRYHCETPLPATGVRSTTAIGQRRPGRETRARKCDARRCGRRGGVDAGQNR